MDKKYQVFISSTYEDLKDARRKVQDAVLSIFHFPVGMELFGASDEEQWEIIQRTIDSSDYYVLIVGQRYGSLIESGPYKGISYTEREFHYAEERGIPILIFLKHDEANYAITDLEKDIKKKKKLEKFKNELKKKRTVVWWKSNDELSYLVISSLVKEIGKKPRPGWIRGDAVDTELYLKQMTALNEENQNLRSEIARMRSKIEDRVPNLYIKMNGKSQIRVEKKEIPFDNWIEAEYAPISMSDVFGEVRGKVTQKQIDEYNANLPSPEEIKDYIDAMQVYRCKKEGGIDIKVTLGNDGKRKAKDINVTLSFPRDLLIIKNNELQYLKEPEAPEKPENPIEEAYKRGMLGGIVASLNSIDQHTRLIPLSSGLNYSLHQIEKYTSQAYVEDNCLEIQRDELLHGYIHDYEEFCIVPLAKGSFTIECSFMCEEYPEPVFQEIIVEVV